MVCCLIGAFILGMIFRAARWTGRSVRSAFGGGRRAKAVPESILPTPVYEVPAYLTRSFDERVPEPV